MRSIVKYQVLKCCIFVLLCISMSGCSGQRSDISTGKKYSIPDSLFSFFSDSLMKFEHANLLLYSTNAEIMDIPYTPREFEITFLSKIYKYTDTGDFSKCLKEYQSLSLKSIKSENNDYFIIGSERDMVAKYDTTILKNMYIHFNETNLIINFHELFNRTEQFYDSTTICGLPKGYTILIIKSGNEYIMPEEYKTEWQILPDKIKHGYRSGVAFKDGEPYMIYWVVAW